LFNIFEMGTPRRKTDHLTEIIRGRENRFGVGRGREGLDPEGVKVRVKRDIVSSRLWPNLVSLRVHRRAKAKKSRVRSQ